VSYELAGNGAAALIFLPALGTVAAMWQPQMVRFASAYTVVAASLGSHDAHGGPRRASLDDFARDALRIMDAVGAVTAHVVGISLGGAIAQVLALSAPERVRSLTLVSTTSHYPSDARSRLLERADAAEAHGMAPLVQSTLERWFTASYRERCAEHVGAIRSMLASADPGAYAEGARAVAAVRTSSLLGAIDCPTLIVEPSEDRSMPQGAARVLADGIPGGRLVSLEGAAHLCTVEKADEFNGILASFLESVEASPPDERRMDVPLAPW
jgi:3-oxoadipate enol-lactonase